MKIVNYKNEHERHIKNYNEAFEDLFTKFKNLIDYWETKNIDVDIKSTQVFLARPAHIQVIREYIESQNLKRKYKIININPISNLKERYNYKIINLFKRKNKKINEIDNKYLYEEKEEYILISLSEELYQLSKTKKYYNFPDYTENSCFQSFVKNKYVKNVIQTIFIPAIQVFPTQKAIQFTDLLPDDDVVYINHSIQSKLDDF